MYRLCRHHLSFCFSNTAPTNLVDRRIVRIDTHDIKAPLDLGVQVFQQVGTVQLLAVSLQEGHVGQHFIFAAVHQRRNFWILLAQLANHQAPFGYGPGGTRMLHYRTT